MIFRLNLKAKKKFYFSTPNYTEFIFLDLLSYVYLKTVLFSMPPVILHQRKYLLQET